MKVLPERNVEVVGSASAGGSATYLCSLSQSMTAWRTIILVNLIFLLGSTCRVKVLIALENIVSVFVSPSLAGGIFV